MSHTHRPKDIPRTNTELMVFSQGLPVMVTMMPEMPIPAIIKLAIDNNIKALAPWTKSSPKKDRITRGNNKIIKNIGRHNVKVHLVTVW
jgi:hypothetical protein